MNPQLMEIVSGCTGLKHLIPNLKLEEMYNRFTESKRNNLVLKEILKTLL
jgi:hypothetical protein